MLLTNKVCVIAGAASKRGIGYATALLFAEHGAKVVVIDVAMQEAIVHSLREGANNEHVEGFACDITRRDDCVALMAKIVSMHGRIDCLVNCAGIVRGKSILEIEDSEYEQVLDVNLKGAFNLCKSVLPAMLAQQSGAIVNLASAAAQRGGGLVGGAHYAASKGGVISLTKTIAREFGRNGIRANVICPAMIDTSMLDDLSSERLGDIVSAIPLNRIGAPREAAGACLFLASELSGFVTGATIDVNGGSHIH